MKNNGSYQFAIIGLFNFVPNFKCGLKAFKSGPKAGTLKTMKLLASSISQKLNTTYNHRFTSISIRTPYVLFH